MMSVVTSAGVVVMLSLMGVGVVAAATAAATTQRVSAAASAAALAAADAATGFASGAPCDRAAQVATAHTATLDSCVVAGPTVTVTVSAGFAGLTTQVAARAGTVPGASASESGWARPSDGEITSHFGQREAPCDGTTCGSSFHEGTDYATGCGAPVYAALGGVVTLAGDDGGFGLHVRLDHGGDTVTGYAHLTEALVAVGETVVAGQLIGLEGNTGTSFGCHLHFEVLVGGTLVDPEAFVK